MVRILGVELPVRLASYTIERIPVPFVMRRVDGGDMRHAPRGIAPVRYYGTLAGDPRALRALAFLFSEAVAPAMITARWGLVFTFDGVRFTDRVGSFEALRVSERDV